jgi:hypothetical protein
MSRYLPRCYFGANILPFWYHSYENDLVFEFVLGGLFGLWVDKV